MATTMSMAQSAVQVGIPPDKARQKWTEWTKKGGPGMGLQVGKSQEVAADKLPEELSGGQSQRAGLARAFAGSPRLILADEPTGSLDFRIGEEVQNLLFRLNEEHGIGLIVATHNRQFAAKIGRQTELKDGQLMAIP